MADGKEGDNNVEPEATALNETEAAFTAEDEKDTPKTFKDLVRICDIMDL